MEQLKLDVVKKREKSEERSVLQINEAEQKKRNHFYFFCVRELDACAIKTDIKQGWIKHHR